MKMPDLLNLLALVLSLASLIVSIVALSAAKRVAAISITTPLVLEHLYEMVEYLNKRKRESTLCTQLKGHGNNLTQAETEALAQRTDAVDKILEALLRDIEPKLESVFKDPFRGQA